MCVKASAGRQQGSRLECPSDVGHSPEPLHPPLPAWNSQFQQYLMVGGTACLGLVKPPWNSVGARTTPSAHIRHVGDTNVTGTCWGGCDLVSRSPFPSCLHAHGGQHAACNTEHSACFQRVSKSVSAFRASRDALRRKGSDLHI